MNQTSTLTDLRYPIGNFTDPVEATGEQVLAWIRILETFPAELRSTVEGMHDEQLDTRYREGGWTVRQVVHHLADSHVNSYIRFKLAVTETNPTIKPYFEDRWAELTDAREGPVDLSLDFLEALHQRWAFFLRRMTPDEWQKTYIHPASGKVWKLTSVLALYAWHCNHHHAHITSLAARMGWNKHQVRFSMESQDSPPDLKRPSLVLFFLLVAIVLAALGLEFLLGLIPGLF